MIGQNGVYGGPERRIPSSPWRGRQRSPPVCVLETWCVWEGSNHCTLLSSTNNNMGSHYTAAGLQSSDNLPPIEGEHGDHTAAGWRAHRAIAWRGIQACTELLSPDNNHIHRTQPLPSSAPSVLCAASTAIPTLHYTGQRHRRKPAPSSSVTPCHRYSSTGRRVKKYPAPLYLGHCRMRSTPGWRF